MTDTTFPEMFRPVQDARAINPADLANGQLARMTIAPVLCIGALSADGQVVAMPLDGGEFDLTPLSEIAGLLVPLGDFEVEFEVASIMHDECEMGCLRVEAGEISVKANQDFGVKFIDLGLQSSSFGMPTFYVAKWQIVLRDSGERTVVYKQG